MQEKEVRAVLFCGAGEVAELAYLYLQLSSIRLAGIIDEKQEGRSFFGFRISGFERLETADWDMVLVTRVEDAEMTVDALIERGVKQERIAII
jgi:hypothetical protein